MLTHIYYVKWKQQPVFLQIYFRGCWDPLNNNDFNVLTVNCWSFNVVAGVITCLHLILARLHVNVPAGADMYESMKD